jgi:hypothetical protein
VKINKSGKPTGLAGIMCEIRWFTHFLAAVMLVIPVAGLVPGDRVNLNVIGSLVLIAALVILDLVITIPLTLWINKLIGHGLAPVRARIKAEIR